MITKETILGLTAQYQLRSKDEIADRISAFFSHMADPDDDDKRMSDLISMSMILFWTLGLDPEQSADTCQELYRKMMMPPEPTEQEHTAVGEYVSIIQKCHYEDKINKITEKLKTENDPHKKIALIQELSEAKIKLNKGVKQ